MKTFYSKNGYLIYKEKLSKSEDKLIKNQLNVTPINTFDTFAENESFEIYKESSSRYRIPRYFGLKHFGIPEKIAKYNHVSIEVDFEGTLNKHTKQDISVQKALETFYALPDFGGGGILNLPPGYGKTTVSLYILCQLKVKTLIIVHKEFLMNQWNDRIQKFIPNASVGSIRGSKIDIQGKDIVLCMLQSLSMKEYDQEIFSSFGFTIIDETHHICSKVFSRAFFKFQTKYMLGLSGTPYRKDGLTKVIEWFIGPIFYSIVRENQNNVFYKVVKFNDESYKDPLPMNSVGKVSIVNVITNILNIESRDMVILEELGHLVNQGRNVMILSERRNHCINLNKMINERYSNISALYMGGMKKAELEESELAQVLVATYSLAHEGLDIPKLDSLIFASPKTDVVQACGRIMRETHGKKHEPYIIDIVDNIALLMNQHRKRKSFYKSSGFNQENKEKTCTTCVEVEQNYAFIDEE